MLKCKGIDFDFLYLVYRRNVLFLQEKLLDRLIGRMVGRRGRKPTSKGLNQADKANEDKMANSGGASKQTLETDVCTLCKVVFSDPDDAMVICERCDEYVCIACANLSQAEYEFLQRTAPLHWFCQKCEKPALSAVKNDRLIEEKCSCLFEAFKAEMQEEIKKQISAIQTTLCSLQERLTTITDTQRIEQKTRDGNVVTDKTVETDRKVVSDTLSDTLNRQRNVVIFGLKEAESNLKDKAKQMDGQSVTDICKIVTENNLTAGQDFEVVRLGKRTEVSEGKRGVSDRPLLVKFTDEKQKRLFMKNLGRLKGLNYKVSIRHDQNKDERQRERDLHEEKERSNKENQDPQYVYVVRGETWNRKVVKIRRRD